VVCSARAAESLIGKMGMGGLTWAGSGWAGFAGSVRERSAGIGGAGQEALGFGLFGG
jgi:hypothetical protein